MCGLRPCTKQAICIIEHSNSQLTALWCPAEITVSQCNCLQQYKHTDPVTGMYFEVTNGSCIGTDLGDLPWCYVSESTCSGQPLLRNGYFWDTCYPAGALACAQAWWKDWHWQACGARHPGACLELGSHETAPVDPHAACAVRCAGLAAQSDVLHLVCLQGHTIRISRR